MPEFVLDIWNILLMALGFSFVIFIHEMGHFIAARWAGIRVHAFSIGFGRAIMSYRKGMGVRLGSSEREYAGRLADMGMTPSKGHLDGVSDTEYRFNWIPFGGYVRMLGQEDGNPNALSAAPDSFTQKPVWKRMVVISGGVIMNVILAVVLFMVVFIAGMKEVPPVIGEVASNSPAAEVGLRPGDVILRINGHRAQTFTDLMIASAMSGPDNAIELEIQRNGERLNLAPIPTRRDAGSGVLKTIGVAPQSSLRLIEDTRDAPRDRLVEQFAAAGISGVEPRMVVVEIDGQPVETRTLPEHGDIQTLQQLRDAAHNSGGQPITLTLRNDETGTSVNTSINPSPEFNTLEARLAGGAREIDHLLGLVPLMKVRTVAERGEQQGLESGDVFLAIGDAQVPSITEAIEAIRDHAGKPISLKLLRAGEVIALEASVDDEGRIGFSYGSAFGTPVIAALPAPPEGETIDVAALRIDPPLEPGSRIVSVNGTPVTSFFELRSALQAATQDSAASTGAPTVTLGALPVEIETGAPTVHAWELSAADARSIRPLGWELDPILEAQFQVATVTLRADDPLQATIMGVQKTHRIMMLTYLTFKRLIQGTVSPKELRGPVGITHIGSQYAAQGFVYLLFFLALISANLAVINFLPIPIVDGGLFVMLLYEGITRRPVPIIVQNVATAIGLAFIITAFLFVTVQDITRLF